MTFFINYTLWFAEIEKFVEHAVIAQKKIDELGREHFEYPYYAGKAASAKFFAHNILPAVGNILRVIKEGDNSVMEIPEASFLV